MSTTNIFIQIHRHQFEYQAEYTCTFITISYIEEKLFQTAKNEWFSYKIISRRKMIFGCPFNCFNTRISRICWISSILNETNASIFHPIDPYLLYVCFIFFAAQNVPSRIFWHFNTSEKVPSPFLPSIRYSLGRRKTKTACCYSFCFSSILTFHLKLIITGN